ncbi:MAG: HEAT repeat domain-containing protein [Anaerolineae bacterium]|nr:HEAT repeat domain-containing protein [Gemmatimonadaceae bacterium]
MNPNIISEIGALPVWNLSMLMLLAKATLILLAALGITLAMQRASAGSRHLVWLVTISALLLVPALASWTPLRLEILPATRATANPTEVRGSPLVSAASSETGQAGLPDRTALGNAESVSKANHSTSVSGGVMSRLAGMSLLSMLVTIWAAMALVLIGSLTYGALVVRRIVRHARTLDTADWLAPLWEVSDRIGLNEPPRLLRSNLVKMPFACGVLRPTIVLPAESDSWTIERRRAVLLHELAHVRRHDLVGHMLGRVACAVYWFHPLVWTAAKRLRSESERACDDLALACGARASDYAEHLLDIVTSVRRDATPSAALAMARRKEFEGRMLAILDPELRHSSPSRRQSVMLIASLAVIALVVGAAAPVPRVDAGSASLSVADTASSTPAQWPVSSDRSGNDAATPVEYPLARPAKVEAEKIAAAIDPRSKEAAIDPRSKTQPAEKSAPITDVEVSALIRLAKGFVADTGNVDDDDRPALLANVLRTDKNADLRRIAAWGLHEYADVKVGAEALANALRRDSDERVREMAAWALGSGDDRYSDALEALSAALRGDASEEVRATSAWALGSGGYEGSEEVLVAALSDASEEVQRRAVWALGNVEPREAPSALVAKLKDKDPKIRQLAAWALFQIRDPNSAPALDAALASETNKDLQLSHIRALAAIGEDHVDAVRKLLDSPDPKIKTMAIKALARGNAGGPWPWPWPEPRPFP